MTSEPPVALIASALAWTGSGSLGVGAFDSGKPLPCVKSVQKNFKKPLTLT